MSTPPQASHDPSDDIGASDDPVERVTRSIPYVLPLAGAGLIFLLAMIAVTMA